MVLKWSDLQRPWQVCFEEAWSAYCSGSLPIGAAIFDQAGNLLARGRNHIFDDHVAPGQIGHNQLAHAELNSLLQIDRRNHDLHTCAIYTSIEPCPLCMGAIYMSGVRTVHFGARDPYAGSTNLLGTTPYLSRKKVKVNAPAMQELEILFLGLLVAAEHRRKRQTGWELFETVVSAWRAVCPAGVAFGEVLYRDKVLAQWTQEGNIPENVFDSLIEIMMEKEKRSDHDTHF